MSDTVSDIAIFSEEEQREIAAQIEAAAKRDLVSPSVMPVRGQASRRGIFPLVVNICGLALLAAGLCGIIFLHREETVTVREKSAVLGITERKLIQEIRGETGRVMNEKDAAIEAMNAKIAGVDAELVRLGSLEALSDDQRRTVMELRGQQEEYRLSLMTLQGERAQILAEARQKEAALYAKLEEQQGAMEQLSGQSRFELDAAKEELAKLSGDQEKAALIEKQLNAYFTGAGRHIQASQYKEAADTIAVLREFLNTPSFASIRSIQARRESDLAALNALSATLEALRSGPSDQAVQIPIPAAPPADGQGDAALRRQLAQQNARLAEQEKTLADLQSKNADAQKTITDKDRQIRSLETTTSAQTQNIKTLNDTIGRLNAELEKR